MRVFQIIALLIAKKAVSLCIIGASTISMLSLFTVNEGIQSIHTLPEQVQIEKHIAAFTNLPMHQGVNNFIEVEGWDKLTYKVAICFNFFKSTNGSYQVKSPKFFMIQQESGMAISYCSLNILDSNNETIKYTCNALKSKRDSSFVNFVFNRYTGKLAENKERTESTFIQFTSPEGENWKAYIDSTYTILSDTSALLRFRLTRM